MSKDLTVLGQITSEKKESTPENTRTEEIFFCMKLCRDLKRLENTKLRLFHHLHQTMMMTTELTRNQ